uniref:AAA domain n=1 Tax=Candidatus Kentrum sp. SD TaxID=2126332 RepID=A0A451BS05_9GAMM|nr:MAG: AAA domain [Candidatus Kentron sp. SD]
MKIQINNFGPIHHFECDLDKDLHLILGKNNIGKSYGITVVYLLVKSLLDGEIPRYAHRERITGDVMEKVSVLNAGEECESRAFRAKS